MKWLKVCRKDEIPERGGRAVLAGGSRIAVFRLSDGRVVAVEDRCPHKEGPLSDGLLTGATVICPMHHWKIDLESGNALPPDCGCVKTYETKVDDGIVWLRL